jgi:N-acetylmuramoyl-L-alanine amidase
MILRSCCVFVILCFSFVTAFGTQLKAIEIEEHKNQISLFFTLDGPFTHKLFRLSFPERVVVDFSRTQLAMNLQQKNLRNALIQKIRVSSGSPNNLRLVLDLKQKVRAARSAPWQPFQGAYGVRIDLVFPQESQSLAKKPANKVPLILANQPPVKVSKVSPKTLGNVIVVLDAGHGGKDCGARGPHLSQEKNVVLAITLKLKRLIDQQLGMHAVLTRSGDYYVGLRERMEIARKYNGDVFVAIHADAFHNPHSKGASVFALSQGGATSEAARWLAEKENYSELGGVNLGELDDQNGVVRSVLIDLSQTATINASLQMGSRVLSQLGTFTALHNSHIEQARFMVLKSPDIPSILIETGFISNPREERNLTDSAYQTRLSQAIFRGIKRYFWENPPHGSRIEAMVSNKGYGGKH